VLTILFTPVRALQDVEVAIGASKTFLEMMPEDIMRSDKYLLAISTYALAMSNSRQKGKFMGWLLEGANGTKGTSSNFCVSYFYCFIVTFYIASQSLKDKMHSENIFYASTIFSL